MSITWTDVTAGTQRLAADNSANVNLGVGTPSAQLSVNGNAVMGSSGLAENTVDSVSLTRYVGSVLVPASGTATISGPTFAGLGVVDGGGFLYSFTLPNSFTVGNPNTTASESYNYSVL